MSLKYVVLGERSRPEKIPYTYIISLLWCSGQSRIKGTGSRWVVARDWGRERCGVYHKGPAVGGPATFQDDRSVLWLDCAFVTAHRIGHQKESAQM
jgi:hypothetical protein